MLVTMIDQDPFVGRIATGRIVSGTVRVGERVKLIKRDGLCTTPHPPHCSPAHRDVVYVTKVVSRVRCGNHRSSCGRKKTVMEIPRN